MNRCWYTRAGGTAGLPAQPGRAAAPKENTVIVSLSFILHDFFCVLTGAGTPELVEPLACLPSLEGLQLMGWLDALYAVHRPSTFAALTAGRRQLAFQVGAE